MLKIRKYLVTGIIAILPLYLTIRILLIIIKWISDISRPFLVVLLVEIIGMKHIELLVRILSFIFTLILLSFLGFLTTIVIGRKILFGIEKFILNIPIFNDIYSAIRKLTSFIFTEKKGYKRVVLVEYPRKGLYSIGFITSEVNIKDENMLTVFIPTTPNPTSGMLVVINKDDVKPLEITIDEAVKMIISGGVVMPHKIK